MGSFLVTVPWRPKFSIDTASEGARHCSTNYFIHFRPPTFGCISFRTILGTVLAPFHRSKNSTADALLIEIFAEAARVNPKAQFYFASRNTRDFSQHNGDQRLPHADLAPIFQADNCHYSISIVDVVRSVAPQLLAGFENEFAYYPEPRGLADLLEAIQLLEQKIWYDRHSMRRSSVEKGDIKIMPREQYGDQGYRPNVIMSDIWQGALAAARVVEDEVGRENLGPWSDFEWGMLNGKLSALRWVLGEDWDMLDM